MAHYNAVTGHTTNPAAHLFDDLPDLPTPRRQVHVIIAIDAHDDPIVLGVYANHARAVKDAFTHRARYRKVSVKTEEVR